MGKIQRRRALISAVLLTLLAAAAHYRGSPRTSPALLAPPRVPAFADFTMETKGGFVRAVRLLARRPHPSKIRGAALREKGEALGGETKDSVDSTTGTLAGQ